MNDAAAFGVLAVLAGVYGVLVIASALVYWLRHRHPEHDYGELRLRINSWWTIVIISSIALLLNRAIAIVFFALVSFLALKEYLSLIPTRRADRRVLFLVYLAVPIQYYWVGSEWYGMFIIFIPVYMFLLLPVAMILVGETKGYVHAAGTLQWGLMSMVFALSHLAFLLVLPADPSGTMRGPGLVLFLIVVTQMNDVAQYCWGKLFGKHKVTPTVSPNKTWEGLIGGIATTLATSVLLAPWLTPFDWRAALIVGALIGVAGFFGDLSISALKRDLGIKDSGTLLPGHGGILDRVDSLTYTAPLFFHFTRYFYF